MQFSVMQWALWLVVAVFQFGVVIRMILSGAWRRWPSLFSFLLILTIKDVVRITNVLTVRNLWTDFSIYWIASLIAQLLEVWIIIQIGQTMLGVSTSTHRVISRAVVAMAAISVIMSTALSMKGALLTGQSLCTIVERLSNSIALALVIVLFAVIVFADQMAEWSAGTRGIAFGITLELTADSYLGWLKIATGHFTHLDVIKSALFLVSLLAWSISTGPRTTDEKLPAMTLATVLSSVQNFQKAIRLFRGYSPQ
jgi:hypothetical protein